MSIGRQMGKDVVSTLAEYFSAKKKKRRGRRRSKLMPFAALWIDLESIILSEVSDRGRQISYDMWDLKMVLQMSLFTKQKQTHRLREELMVTFGEVQG